MRPASPLKETLNFQSFKFSLTLVLTGVSAGFIAYGFHKIPYLIAASTGTLSPFGFQAFFACLGLTFFSLFLSRNFFAETHGSGIPQVKLSLVANKGRM